MRRIDARRRHDRAQLKPVEFDLAYTVRAEHRCDETCALPCSRVGLIEDVDREEHFTCRGNVSSIMLSEFAHNADVDVSSGEGMELIRELFSDAFADPAEYKRFFRAARHLDDDDLMDVMGAVIEEFSARPTQQLSPSPKQPATTGSDSQVVSLPGGYEVASTG